MSAGIDELRAQDNKLIRVSANRSASAVSLWGFDPFGKKYGLRVEVNAATTNADMQRAVQSGGVEIATLGYQMPAVMAEQKVSNVKIIAGASVGGQNLIMRKGAELRSWKDLEGKRIGRPPGTYVMILFTLAAQEFGVDLTKVISSTRPRLV
jgi:ABC-type nitrate/sulfonate/bicarbonate transport system substrate-binding protein